MSCVPHAGRGSQEILSFVLVRLLGKTGQQKSAQFCPLLPLQRENQEAQSSVVSF